MEISNTFCHDSIKFLKISVINPSSSEEILGNRLWQTILQNPKTFMEYSHNSHHHKKQQQNDNKK